MPGGRERSGGRVLPAADGRAGPFTNDLPETREDGLFFPVGTDRLMLGGQNLIY